MTCYLFIFLKDRVQLGWPHECFTVHLHLTAREAVNIQEVAEPLQWVLNSLPKVANKLIASRLHERYQVNHLSTVVRDLQSSTAKWLILQTNPVVDDNIVCL